MKPKKVLTSGSFNFEFQNLWTGEMCTGKTYSYLSSPETGTRLVVRKKIDVT